MSCSQILNDYDGVRHDYTRKQGLVWQQVFLPEHAPQGGKTAAFYGTTVRKMKKTKGQPPCP
ncbi:MAG: MobA/MobL family protein [Oscillospiraceae bacterium]